MWRRNGKSRGLGVRSGEKVSLLGKASAYAQPVVCQEAIPVEKEANSLEAEPLEPLAWAVLEAALYRPRAWAKPGTE